MSQHISEDKVMQQLHELLKAVGYEQAERSSRELSITFTKIEEAVLWRRADLLKNTNTDFS